MYSSDLPLQDRILSHIDNITGFYYNYNQTSSAIAFVNSQGFVNSTGLQVYNESLLILGLNTTSNIMSLGFYNQTQINSLISSVGNSSFNQSLTDLLYYSISNPNGYVNLTQSAVYNDTALVLNVNSSIWNYLISNQDNWISIYNSTYNNILSQNCPAGLVVNGTLGNGTIMCTSISASTSGNLFNQVLNTSSNVSFGNVSASTGFFSFLGSLTNRIGKIFVNDIDVSNNLSVNGNVSSKFYLGSLNYSDFPTSSCSGSDKVIGVNSSGGVVCGADLSSGSQSVSPKLITLLSAAVTDTNAPANERIVGNSQYLVCTNVSGYSQFRYGFARSGNNGATDAIVYIKYTVSPTTTVAGSAYTNLSTSVAIPSLIYTTPNLANLSIYHSMDNNLGDVCLGAFQVGGSGSLDPQWRNIWVELS